jgi:hypothetical protein
MPIANHDGSAHVDITYHPNDALAQLIVTAWSSQVVRDALLNDARPFLAQAGLYISHPKIITQQEFHKGTHKKAHPDEIVLVLPQQPGDSPPGANLLETARFLMAVVPNGI